MSVTDCSFRHMLQVALVGLLALHATACKDKDLGQRQASIIQVTDTAGLSPAQQALVLEAATDYDTDSTERGPLAITDGQFPGVHTPGDSAPHMTIATMHLKEGHARPSHRLIARIKSDSDYAGLGIKSGTNLVWRSSWDSTGAATWVTKIVPLKGGAAEYVLHRDARLHEYTMGSAAEPRLVKVATGSFAIAACLDDPMCGSGHCGYW